MIPDSLKRAAVAAFVLTAVTVAVPSQIVGPGLVWNGSSGAYAGGFFQSCTPQAVALTPGETVTLAVWGDFMASYGLVAATSASRCVTLPGIRGGLVLDPPLLPVGAGVLTRLSPCLSCPPAFETILFAVPRGLPSGTSFAVQALSFGGGTPAFTVGIVASS